MSNLLNILIGLVLMYLTLALIVTAVQEAISGILQWRAHTLAQNLRTMLEANVAPASGSLPSMLQQIWKGPKLPGAVPTANVNTAIHDAILAHPLVSPTGRLPSYIASPKFALALLDAVSAQAANTQAAFSRFEAGVAALPPGRLRTALTTLTVDAAGDIERLKASLASWFDDVMDRVAGVYKRWSAVASFVIGLLLALFLVADTIGVLQHLASDPRYAQAVANTAPGATATTASTAVANALGLTADPGYWFKAWSAPNGASAHLLTLVGCLMTAIALSLGAPFWFDLLNSFLNLRSAGPVPDKASAGNGSTSASG